MYVFICPNAIHPAPSYDNLYTLAFLSTFTLRGTFPQVFKLCLCLEYRGYFEFHITGLLEFI